MMSRAQVAARGCGGDLLSLGAAGSSDLLSKPSLPPPNLNTALIRGWISKASKCPSSSLPQIYQLSFSSAYISYSNTNEAAAVNPEAERTKSLGPAGAPLPSSCPVLPTCAPLVDLLLYQGLNLLLEPLQQCWVMHTERSGAA